MPEHSERILRIACYCLAALLVFQFARLGLRKDPLRNLSIPALPFLPPAADAQAGGTQTNPPMRSSPITSETHAATGRASGEPATNPVAGRTGTKIETNAVAPSRPSITGTNALASQGAPKERTNTASGPESTAPGTAAVARPGPGGRGMGPGSPPDLASMGMNPMARQGPGMRGPPLPPAVQARVDRIVESEMLAPIIRPMPMALLGIAGKDVFLRAPNGQTGLMKEGDELGGVKLLRIGTNRVLVEEAGQKKELTVFAGLGGESLLPKEKDGPL